jgi:hypothetical protein
MAVDLYVTGSTAFRKQVYSACVNLFSSAPAIQYDTLEKIGGDGTSTSSNPVWTMSGNAASGITALGGGALAIHANFTGSVQGCQTVENKVQIVFLTTAGAVMTNTPTIAFSDVSSKSTPYPVSGSFNEEKVAVQPFVIVKSHTTSSSMNSISNITWDELKSIISLGNLPLSEWSGNVAADYNTPIYILNRTEDSGTRRTIFAELGYGFAAGITTYNYDVTNHVFYQPSGDSIASAGESAYAVIGGYAGYNNANLNWGPGYVAGSDVGNAMKVTDAQNLSLGYLSVSDAKSITGVNWSQVIALNGLWPTAAGPGISGNIGTNDFTPVCAGFYPYWSYEVVVYPTVNPSGLSNDQNLTAAQLGNQTTAGTILGVLDKVNAATPISGSLDNEIQNSKTSGATAIRVSDMTSSRAAVGGAISP